jgi:L-2,4-diaminobutyrate transaminase
MATDPLHNLSLEERDKRSILHPYTSIKDHLANGPFIIASGSGVHVTDRHGRRYIDGAAGLWCVNVGYGRKEIIEAMVRQAERLPYFHSFGSMSNEPAIHLAERILRHVPDNMSKVFFGTSGSDANDTNVKLVWYYNNLRDKPRKKKIISRKRGYHGVTVAAGSLTGIPSVHEAFDLPLPQMLHTSAADPYRERPVGMDEPGYARHLADELEALILREGSETIAAFIAEPVMGTGGVLVPPDGYFAAIQDVLNRYDVLMIADEVICGFGRLGHWFGSNCFDIRPDIMTLAKGLSSGYQPISASVISDRIWSVLEEFGGRLPAFGHGYTYNAHPIAAAASLANLEIIERERLVGNAAKIGELLKRRLEEELGDLPIVGDIRGKGLMLGIELVSDRATKAPIDFALKVGTRVVRRGYEEGIIVRTLPHGNVIAISPPLTFSADNVEELVEGLRASITYVMEELARDGALRDM